MFALAPNAFTPSAGPQGLHCGLRLGGRSCEAEIQSFSVSGTNSGIRPANCSGCPPFPALVGAASALGRLGSRLTTPQLARGRPEPAPAEAGRNPPDEAGLASEGFCAAYRAALADAGRIRGAEPGRPVGAGAGCGMGDAGGLSPVTSVADFRLGEAPAAIRADVAAAS